MAKIITLKVVVVSLEVQQITIIMLVVAYLEVVQTLV